MRVEVIRNKIMHNMIGDHFVYLYTYSHQHGTIIYLLTEINYFDFFFFLIQMVVAKINQNIILHAGFYFVLRAV